MNDRPTPETDAFFRSFADGDATPSHAEYYDRMTQLERERDEAREWKDMLSGWGGTPEIVHEFIKGQQARIHAVQDIERELDQAKQDAKQNELDCLRALGERNEARAEVQAIQHWATANGTIQMQREIDEARKERDEALRLLEKWEQVAIGGGMRVLELTKQRDKLAEAAKLIADEYEDRRCQFGGDYLWTKHEQTEDIENALAIINKNDNE